jgi:hypothetical protein
VFDVIRGITFGIMWLAIGLNVFALCLNARGIRRNRELCEKLKTLISETIRQTLD